MLHLGIFLYLLALISGIIVISRYISLYQLSKNRAQFWFILFKAVYSLLVICGLVVLYLEVNVHLETSLLGFFTAWTQICCALLLWTLSFFLLVKNNVEISKKYYVLNGIFSIWCVLWTMIFVIFPDQTWSLFIPLAVLLPFLVLILYYLLLALKPKKGQTRKSNDNDFRLSMILLLVFGFLTAIELIFLIEYSLNKGLILSLAISYMVLNLYDLRFSHIPKALDSPSFNSTILMNQYDVTNAEIKASKLLIQGLSNNY
jgi:hypothetical protein